MSPRRSTLTEVKIKGKARPHQPWRPPPPRRVMKRRRDGDEMADDSSQQGSRRKLFKARSPPAPIEALPTEILEPIIFMSGNLNFLRSSLRIGYRFSSPSFLTELCITAFAPTWDMWFGYNRDEIGPNHVHLLDPAQLQGNPDFQSAILACSWAKTSILLEAQQHWYRRHGGPGRPSEYAPKDPEHPLAPPETAFGRSTDVTALFEKDWEAFKRCSIGFFSSANPLADGPSAEQRLTLARESLIDADFIELHPSVAIPKRLIVGPFDWESARTLFWIVRGGGRLLHDHTWEMTWRGYEHIMNLSDWQLALVLALLFERLRAFEFWPRFLVARGLQHALSQMRFAQRPAVQELGRGLSEILDPASNYRRLPEQVIPLW